MVLCAAAKCLIVVKSNPRAGGAPLPERFDHVSCDSVIATLEPAGSLGLACIGICTGIRRDPSVDVLLRRESDAMKREDGL